MKKNFLSLTLVSLMLLLIPVLPTVSAMSSNNPYYVVNQGLACYKEWRKTQDFQTAQAMLTAWFLSHPSVANVKTINQDMTVSFKSGVHILILGHTELAAIMGKPLNPGGGHGGGKEETVPASDWPTAKNATLLDPFNWEGGVFKNPELFADIIGNLTSKGYTVSYYLNNSQVTLRAIESDLTVGVVFNRGHGGYDSDTGNVVICTGEQWNDSTTTIYNDEYSNGWIVAGYIYYNGEYIPFITYEPGLIFHYYAGGKFFNSLVYMESCDGLKNPTMGDAYISGGAASYVGWTSSVTVDYGDSTSQKNFYQLCTLNYSVSEAVATVKKIIITGSGPSSLEYDGEAELGL